MRAMSAVLAVTFLAAAPATAAGSAAGAPKQAASFKPQASGIGAEAITIPQMLSYQGKLTDTLGVPVADGEYPMMFLLYTVPTGGSAFWSENQSVETKNGLFNVLIGAVTPIDSVPSGGAVYLAMTVSGGPQLTPRLRIGSAAFAYLSGRAANADLLQGRDTTTFSRSNHNHDANYVNEGQVDAVTSSMIVNGAVLTAEIGDTAVTMAKIAQAGATTGQVVKWTGSAWAPGQDNTGGGSGVTNVYQDTGIICVPNPITSSGNVKLDLSYGDGRYVNEAQSNSVTGAMIADGNVTSADIRDTTLNTAELKDAAVTAAKLNQMGASTNQVLKWTGSAWAPRNDSLGVGTVRKVLQATGVVCSPNPITDSGTVRFDSTWGDARFVNEAQTAGGDLAGAYPSPSVDGLQGRAVAATAPTSGQALKWNGTTWTPMNDSLGTGTVKSVSPGTGIVCTPNPITDTGRVRLDSAYTDGRYIRNQNSAGQTANFMITGTGQAAQFYGISAAANVSAVRGNGGYHANGVFGESQNTSYAGVYGWGANSTDGVDGGTNSASHFAIRGNNVNASGTGIVGVGNSATASYLTAGSGGAFTGTGYGSYHKATSSSGTAVVGLGNNVSSLQTYADGSGGAFAGTVCGGYGEATSTSGYTYGLYGEASSTIGFGSYGHNSNTGGTGVAGVGNNTTGYQLTAGSGGAFSGTDYGLYGRATNTIGAAAYFENQHGTVARVAYYNGTTEYKILGDGAVSTTMSTRGGKKTLFAPEMPEAYFEDAGEGQLVDGHCRVNLEHLFYDCVTVNAGQPLKVFVQLEDDCNGVYVKKDLTGFDVYELHGGESDARFSWRVLAKWKGNENVRLPDAPGPLSTVTVENPRAADRQSEAVAVPAPREAIQAAPVGQ